MEEYHDCLQRARRLAVASEATLTGSDSAMSVVTMDDLLIYTRWFICMLHSVKKINGFIRVRFSKSCSLIWTCTRHRTNFRPVGVQLEPP